MNKLLFFLMAICVLNAPVYAKPPAGFYPPSDSLNSNESVVLGEPTFSYAPVTRSSRINTSCQPTGRNSMQCQVVNVGNDTGESCIDVVKICGDGEHTSIVCSGRLDPGEVDSKVISSFSPHVKLLTKCAGFEFRNKVTPY